MASRTATGLVIAGVLSLVGLVALARPGNSQPLRRLRIVSLDRQRERLTYAVEFRSWPGEPDTQRQFTVPVQDGHLFEDFANHQVIVTGDSNTSQIAADLYGPDGYQSVYRIHIDFVRKLQHEGPVGSNTAKTQKA